MGCVPPLVRTPSEDDRLRCQKVFDLFDTNKDGFIGANEFRKLVNYPELQSSQRDKMTEAEIDQTLKQLDTSKDGKISFEEFLQWWSNSLEEDPEEKSALSQIPIIRKNIKSETFLQNFTRFGFKETFYCTLCFEYQLASEESFQLQGCNHRYCLDCLQGYVANAVNNGQVVLTCFHDKPKSAAADSGLCGANFTESDMLKLLDEEGKKKYEKFKLNKDDSNHRQCSKCDTSQLGNPSKPDMVCNNCQHRYCFFHGDSHPNSDCTEYERVNAVELKKTNDVISEKCKKCPECTSPILKSGGCNHMKCPSCRCSFCWLCMTVIDDSPFPAHFKFDPKNPTNTCVGRQMEENTRTNYFLGHVTGWRKVCLIFTFACTIIGLLFIALPVAFAFTVLDFVLRGACYVKDFLRLRSDPAYNQTRCCTFIWTKVKHCFWIGIQGVCIVLILLPPFLCWCACVHACGCLPSQNSEEDFEGLETVNGQPTGDYVAPPSETFSVSCHPHPLRNDLPFSNWRCDGENCLSGLNVSGAANSSSIRYRCRECDYDLCDVCYLASVA